MLWTILIALTAGCGSRPDYAAIREAERLRNEVAALTWEQAALKRELLTTKGEFATLQGDHEAVRARLATLEGKSAAKTEPANASTGSPAEPGVHSKVQSDRIGRALIPVPIAAPPPATEPAVQLPLAGKPPDLAEPATPTVYVTASGAKYHRSTCRYASAATAISLSDAIQRNEPCKICRPPGRESLQAPISPTAAKATDVVAPSSKPATVATDGRCGATTQKGSRCKRSAAKSRAYCWQHGG